MLAARHFPHPGLAPKGKGGPVPRQPLFPANIVGGSGGSVGSSLVLGAHRRRLCRISAIPDGTNQNPPALSASQGLDPQSRLLDVMMAAEADAGDVMRLLIHAGISAGPQVGEVDARGIASRDATPVRLHPAAVPWPHFSRRQFGLLGPIGRSAVEARLRHFATVLVFKP